MFRCVPDKEFFCLVLSYFNIKPDMRIVSHGSSDSLTESKDLRDLQCVFPRGILRRANGACDYSHVCITKIIQIIQWVWNSCEQPNKNLGRIKNENKCLHCDYYILHHVYNFVNVLLSD